MTHFCNNVEYLADALADNFEEQGMTKEEAEIILGRSYPFAFEKR